MVSTVLPSGFDECIFESNMSIEQHKHFNQLLNNLMTNPPAASGRRVNDIKYEHLFLVDEFYPLEDNGRDRRSREKVAFCYIVPNTSLTCTICAHLD